MREARNFLAAILGVACALVVLFTIGGVFNSTTSITNNPTEAFAGRDVTPSSINSNTGSLAMEYQTVLTIVVLSAFALVLALAVTYVASHITQRDDFEHIE
ncbi:MAG: hypothetical protein M1368_04960 [Thaumarchaeota archaeon]|nr:hypothetical protein [Nitrososphaerota archaeon]